MQRVYGARSITLRQAARSSADFSGGKRGIRTVLPANRPTEVACVSFVALWLAHWGALSREQANARQTIRPTSQALDQFLQSLPMLKTQWPDLDSACTPL